MTPADQYEPHSPNEAVIRKFFVTLMEKDLDGFEDLWAEDAVQEIPFPPEVDGFEPVWNGKERIVSYYRQAIPKRRDHVFLIDQMHQTVDPDVIAVEAAAHSVVADTGKSYDQRYVFFFRLRDGLIVLNREYVNPLPFMRTFGA